MRVYKDVLECVKEQERDLIELGIEVQGASMQNKDVTGDEDFYFKEIVGTCLTITSHKLQKEALEYVNERYKSDLRWDWIEAEFKERVMQSAFVNPGAAWRKRHSVWQQFLNDQNKFDYTYHERMKPQLNRIIRELIAKPGTRQAIISIHDNNIDLKSLGGAKRIPCSLFFQMFIREGKLELIYTMRSCDFATHFVNDIILAQKLQKHIADAVKVGVGNFIYFCGSLHLFRHSYKHLEIF